jgi:hypothetical protein
MRDFHHAYSICENDVFYRQIMLPEFGLLASFSADLLSSYFENTLDYRRALDSAFFLENVVWILTHNLVVLISLALYIVWPKKTNELSI